jgi:hypothetical protein
MIKNRNLEIQYSSAHPELTYMDVGNGGLVWNNGLPVEGFLM